MIKNLLCASALLMLVGLNAQTTVFQEDFETEGARASWVNTDRDGDGQLWEFYNDELDNFTGWYATSWSWWDEAFTPDNTLTSPSFNLPNNTDKELTLTFDVGALFDDTFEEHYAVYVIPANTEFQGTEIPVFEETLDAGYVSEAKHISVDVSQFAGQEVKLVFRHYDCTDILAILLDEIKIVESPKMSTSDASKAQVSVYPNPTSDVVKINGLAKVDKVRIFDMQGKIVAETTSKEINVKHLPVGQYLVNIYTGNNVVTKKLIKE